MLLIEVGIDKYGDTTTILEVRVVVCYFLEARFVQKKMLCVVHNLDTKFT